jgi:hypothetical protein
VAVLPVDGTAAAAAAAVPTALSLPAAGYRTDASPFDGSLAADVVLTDMSVEYPFEPLAITYALNVTSAEAVTVEIYVPKTRLTYMRKTSVVHVWNSSSGGSGSGSNSNSSGSNSSGSDALTAAQFSMLMTERAGYSNYSADHCNR